MADTQLSPYLTLPSGVISPVAQATAFTGELSLWNAVSGEFYVQRGLSSSPVQLTNGNSQRPAWATGGDEGGRVSVLGLWDVPGDGDGLGET